MAWKKSSVRVRSAPLRRPIARAQLCRDADRTGPRCHRAGFGRPAMGRPSMGGARVASSARMTAATEPPSCRERTPPMPINHDAATEEYGAPIERSWDSKDALLYAVGVGAGSVDPNALELEFTT